MDNLVKFFLDLDLDFTRDYILFIIFMVS